MRLLVTAFIVSFGPIFSQPYNEAVPNEVDDAGKIQKNFQNLFDSIKKNELVKTETYRTFLEQETAREQQAFANMKEEIRNARQKNRFDKKDGRKIKESIVSKRETNKEEYEPGAFYGADNVRARFRHMCQDLVQLNVDSFMRRSLAHFDHLCQAMSKAHALGYRNVYNDILASTFVNFNNGSTQFYVGLKPGLSATNNKTTFLLEFTVSRSLPEAMAAVEQRKDKYYGSGTDILGLGINFHFDQAPFGYFKVNGSVDKLRCEWEGKLYSDSGELKRIFAAKRLALNCPYMYRAPRGPKKDPLPVD